MVIFVVVFTVDKTAQLRGIGLMMVNEILPLHPHNLSLVVVPILASKLVTVINAGIIIIVKVDRDVVVVVIIIIVIIVTVVARGGDRSEVATVSDAVSSSRVHLLLYLPLPSTSAT
jgi:hypothetical protein